MSAKLTIKERQAWEAGVDNAIREAGNILAELDPPKVKRNRGKITVTLRLDLGRIGPVTVAANYKAWAELWRYLEAEPDNFLADMLEAAREAARVNPTERTRKVTDQAAKARRIAPHLYVELKHWLPRTLLHPPERKAHLLSESLARHGINPAAGGVRTPHARVFLKMINAAYGKQYTMSGYRDFYKNYIQPRLARVEAIHKKAGYPMNRRMFQEVLFPKK